MGATLYAVEEDVKAVVLKFVEDFYALEDFRNKKADFMTTVYKEGMKDAWEKVTA